MNSERPATIAGSFYPRDADSLSRLVRRLLDESRPSTESPINPDSVRALIVPHGEFSRSGPVAASAYRLLSGRSKPPDRVVIAAPLHYFPEYGIVLPTVSSFQIPTGPLPVDRKSIQKLAFHAETLFSEEAHAYEHSIETQLPFLREIWGGIPIVPLGFADISTDVLSRILDSFLSDPETLLLITSDFSHYFDYDRAKAIDNQTFDQILTGHPIDILHSCGAIGINALGKLARSHSLSFHLLDARNSGDITGSKSQVTGYGAFALSDETQSRK